MRTPEPIADIRTNAIPDAAAPAFVAIVESDEATRNSIEFVLRAEGYAAAGFRDGGALLAHAGTLEADAFVLDHHLPDMTGLDLLTRLRAAGAEAPVLVLAGRVTPELRRRAAAMDAPILDKPLTGDALSAALSALLERR